MALKNFNNIFICLLILLRQRSHHYFNHINILLGRILYNFLMYRANYAMLVKNNITGHSSSQYFGNFQQIYSVHLLKFFQIVGNVLRTVHIGCEDFK
jgi:hypothetical protein